MKFLTCHSVCSNFRCFILSEDNCNSRYYGKRPQSNHSGQHSGIKLTIMETSTVKSLRPTPTNYLPDVDISYSRLAISEPNENNEYSSTAEREIQKKHIS